MNFKDLHIEDPTVANRLSQQFICNYLQQKFSQIKSKTWRAEMIDDDICIWYRTRYCSHGRIKILFNASTTDVFNIRVCHVRDDNDEPEPIWMLDYPKIRFTPEMYKKIQMWFNHLNHDLGLNINLNYNTVLFDFKDCDSMFRLKSMDKDMNCIMNVDLLFELSSYGFKWLLKNINKIPPMYFIVSHEPRHIQILKALQKISPTDGTVFTNLKTFTLYEKYKRMGFDNKLHLPATYSLYYMDPQKIALFPNIKDLFIPTY